MCVLGGVGNSHKKVPIGRLNLELIKPFSSLEPDDERALRDLAVLVCVHRRPGTCRDPCLSEELTSSSPPRLRQCGAFKPTMAMVC